MTLKGSSFCNKRLYKYSKTKHNSSKLCVFCKQYVARFGQPHTFYVEYQQKLRIKSTQTLCKSCAEKENYVSSLYTFMYFR